MQSILRTAVHTESKRDSPRFDRHALFFVCAADETLLRMHQWYKLFRKACIFFAFVLVLSLTTSTSALLYQVCMYVIVLYTCVSYVLHVVAGCDRSYVRNIQCGTSTVL